jgi:hypothetical protein
MQKKIVWLSLSIIFFVAITNPAHARTFEQSDLKGIWHFYMLTSGDFPQWTGWAHGTQEIDTEGNVNWTSFTRSDGSSDLPSYGNVTIGSDGIISITGTDFHGTMNRQRNVIKGVMTHEGGGYAFINLTKQGSQVYNTSDLEGTWRLHMLASGDSPQWTGWAYGAQEIDFEGNLEWLSFERSDGNSDLTPYAALTLSSDGIVTIPGEDFYGSMNTQKNMIFGVMTYDDGGYAFLNLTKNNGESYDASDLEGIWRLHMLTSGDSPQWTGWVYGKQAIDVEGNMNWTAITRSDGDASLPSSNIALGIDSNGVVTGIGRDFTGAMNAEKDMIVGVMTDGGGGYDFLNFTKNDTIPDTDNDGVPDPWDQCVDTQENSYVNRYGCSSPVDYDVNDDGKTGLEEAIHILQIISGFKFR